MRALTLFFCFLQSLVFAGNMSSGGGAGVNCSTGLSGQFYTTDGANCSFAFPTGGAEINAGNSGSAITIDWSQGISQKVALTANTTFTFSNLTNGGYYLLRMVTDSGGPYTQTWPASVLWNGSAVPKTNVASSTDYATFYYDGTKLRGSFWTEAVPSVLAMGNGSAGSPSMTFASDLTTGGYSSASGNYDIATGGTRRLNVDNLGGVNMMSSSGAHLKWNTNAGGDIGSGTTTTIANAPGKIYFNTRLQGNKQNDPSVGNFYVDVSGGTADLEVINGGQTRFVGILVDSSYGYLAYNGAGNFMMDGTNVYVNKPFVDFADNTHDIGSTSKRFRSGYFATSIFNGNYVVTPGEHDAGNSSTSLAVDLSTGNSQKVTLTGNLATFTWTNPVSGGRYQFRIVQGSGPYTITWPAAVKWPSATAPTLSTGNGKIDIYEFFYDGTSYYGKTNGQNY